MMYLLRATILLALCSFGYCCRCVQLSNEKHYCNSQFVIYVKVRSALVHPTTQLSGGYYVIDILRTYKFLSTSDLDIKKKRVYTSDITMCGVTLQKGKRYLITGYLSEMHMHINTCSSWIEQAPLSPMSTQLLNNPPTCA